MSRRRIVIVIALAAGLALAVWVGAFVWPALNLRPAKVFTLPDGTAVMFYRATYDTNYEVAYGTGWRDHVAQLIPAHFRANLDLKVARVSAVTVSSLSGTTNPEMLVIWMKTLQPGSNAPPTAAASIAGSRGPAPRPATAAPRIRLNIVDDSGLEAAGINQGANGPLMPVIIPNFPRRSRTLHVRIRSLGNLSFSAGDNLPVIGDFDIPNPARRGGRVLTANPLPQSRTNNGVEVSLVRLETGHAYSDFAAQPAISPVTGQPLHGIAATGIFGTDSDAILKLKEDGRDTTSNWSVRFVYATTPAYPIPVRQNVIRSKLTPDGLLCPFGIALWPEDPVWDLTLEILRTTNFPPE